MRPFIRDWYQPDIKIYNAHTTATKRHAIKMLFLVIVVVAAALNAHYYDIICSWCAIIMLESACSVPESSNAYFILDPGEHHAVDDVGDDEPARVKKKGGPRLLEEE